MERVYHETSAQLQQAQSTLAQLERASDEREAQATVQTVHSFLREIDDGITRLDILVNKEPPTRRQSSRYKVDQLKADTQAVKKAVDSIHSRLLQRWRYAQDREELFTTRFRANDSTHVPIDDSELSLNTRLNSSNRHVDDLISQGSTVLENLKLQGVSLQGVRRKIHDIGAQLGLSNTTLSMIDRRVREDWFIFVLGAIFVLFFIFCFYKFWRD